MNFNIQDVEDFLNASGPTLNFQLSTEEIEAYKELGTSISLPNDVMLALLEDVGRTIMTKFTEIYAAHRANGADENQAYITALTCLSAMNFSFDSELDLTERRDYDTIFSLATKLGFTTWGEIIVQVANPDVQALLLDGMPTTTVDDLFDWLVAGKYSKEKFGSVFNHISIIGRNINQPHLIFEFSKRMSELAKDNQ